MSPPIAVSTPASPNSAAAFAEFSVVALRRAVRHRDITFPAGTRGVIVHRHDDGEGYEVEFSQPVQAVLSLTGRDLA